jgi:type IV secretion system protein VirD4
MKFIKIFVFICLCCIFLFVFGQYAAGFFLLKRFGLNPSSVHFLTFYQYFLFYKERGGEVGFFIKIAFILSFLPLCSFLFFMSILFLKSSKRIDQLYGNARFATKVEIKKENMYLNQESQEKWPPILLGKQGKKFVVDRSQESISLAALPGSGKGVSFVIPNLLFYSESIVIFDPKLENFRITSGYRSKILFQEVYLFAPDQINSHSWNPLDFLSKDPQRTLFDIKTLTSIIIEAPEGENKSFYLRARQALDGILLYLMESDDEERTIYNAILINDPDIGFVKWVKNLFQRRKDLSPDCMRLLQSYANEYDKQRDITRGIINMALHPFSDAYTRAATRSSSFNFEDLRKKKISVYVGIAPSNIPKFRTMLNLFFSQAIALNTSLLPEDSPRDLKYQVLFLLDEFVALGPIEIIRSSAGYTRGYNIRYAIIFQNKAQIFANECYGKAGGESLLNTFQNEIVFATENLSEATEYSERLGYITLKHRDRSRTHGYQNRSVTENLHRYKRALMLPQEIQRLPYTEELFFKKGGRLLPIKMNKICWYKEPLFKKRAYLPVPFIPFLLKKG